MRNSESNGCFVWAGVKFLADVGEALSPLKVFCIVLVLRVNLPVVKELATDQESTMSHGGINQRDVSILQ